MNTIKRIYKITVNKKKNFFRELKTMTFIQKIFFWPLIAVLLFFMLFIILVGIGKTNVQLNNIILVAISFLLKGFLQSVFDLLSKDEIGKMQRPIIVLEEKIKIYDLYDFKLTIANINLAKMKKKLELEKLDYDNLSIAFKFLCNIFLVIFTFFLYAVNNTNNNHLIEDRITIDIHEKVINLNENKTIVDKESPN